MDIDSFRPTAADRERIFFLSLDMLCVAGMDGYFKRLNPAFEKVLGFTTEELLAVPFIEFVHPDDRQTTLAELEKLTQGQETVDFENRYRCRNDSYKWLLWNVTPDRQAQLLYAAARDITPRKQSEEKIREQAALLDVATDAILVRDLEDRIVFWNRGASQLYGWQKSEVLGASARPLLCPTLTEAEFDQMRTQLLEWGEWRGKLQQMTKSGKALTVNSRWTLVRDEEGLAKSFLVVNTDVTEKEQLEAQFLRIQRLESIGTLAGGIAHDLNNILTPILAIAQLLPLKIPDADDHLKQLFELLQTSARRGGALVKQVLAFASGADGRHTVLQVRHVIGEIQQIIRETFPREIDLQVQIDPDLWAVYGDATQIFQILMNLCVNARDAMPGGGQLHIRASNFEVDENYARMNLEANMGRYIAIVITDTGGGIPPDIQERIFEPFFTTKQSNQGTGLGLPTALSLIKKHDGFLDIYSELGQGTQVKVFIPADPAPEGQSVPDVHLPQGQGELILVVDDEDSIRSITQKTLESYNYQVITAADGIDAIASYGQYQHQIKAVLLDLMMPSMDGVMTLKTLYKMNPHISVIAISGLRQSEKITAVFEEGIAGFLLKPYTAEELLTTLQQALRGQSG